MMRLHKDMRGLCLAGMAWAARLALTLCLAAAARVGECAELRCDGTIVRLDGDLAYVELPTWPVDIDEDMFAAFFEVLDIFISTNGTDVLVADIDVKNVVRVEKLTRDFAVLKMRDTADSQAVEATPGRAVLIRRELKRGRQLAVVYNPRAPILGFIETFSEGAKLGTFWETLPGAGRVEDGKLVVEPLQGRLRNVRDPHAGQLSAKLPGIGYESKYKFNERYLTRSPLGIEFDFESSKGHRLKLDIGGNSRAFYSVSYVVGHHEGKQQGIYWDEKAMAKARGRSARSGRNRAAKHVFISITAKSTSMEVDNTSYRADLPNSPIEKGFRNIVFFSEGKFSIDNFKLWWMPKAPPAGDYPASILGNSLKKDRILIARGGGKAWEGTLVGRGISFRRSSGEVLAESVVASEIDDMLVSRVVPELSKRADKDTVIRIEESRVPGPFAGMHAAPSGPTERPPEPDEVAMRLIPQKQMDTKEVPIVDIVTPPPGAMLAALEENGDREFELRPMTEKKGPEHSFLAGKLQSEQTGSFELCLANTGKLSSVGYVSPILQTISHPVSGCVVGARLGPAVSCSLRQSDTYVTVTPAAGQPVSTKDAQEGLFVISRARPPAGTVLAELLGRAYTCDFDSSSKSFWEEANGQWRRTKGRLISSSPTEKWGVPMLIFNHELRGNLQFDFDVIVEKPAQQAHCTYTKDISCLFYSTTKKTAVTIGFGAEGYGGVSFDRGTPSGGGGQRYIRELKDAGEWVGGGHGRYIGGFLEAKLGRNYSMRVRKLGPEFVMYINNRRVTADKFPDVEGDIQAWIIAPESVLSIDNVTLQELPKSERYLKDHPPLGEFGYVLAGGEDEIIVDSGVPGQQKGAAVRIAKCSGITRAQNDARTVQSADFECAAYGVVTETGMRMSRVRIVQKFEPVVRGMKVFTGQGQKTFSLSGTEMADIDRVL